MAGRLMGNARCSRKKSLLEQACDGIRAGKSLQEIGREVGRHPDTIRRMLQRHDPALLETVRLNRNAIISRQNTIFRAEIDGKTLPLKDWAEISGIPYMTLRGRFKRGIRGRALINPERARNIKYDAAAVLPHLARRDA
jgi:hypothetical protein